MRREMSDRDEGQSGNAGAGKNGSGREKGTRVAEGRRQKRVCAKKKRYYDLFDILHTSKEPFNNSVLIIVILGSKGHGRGGGGGGSSSSSGPLDMLLGSSWFR
jgi:hypothetical protein